MVETSLTFGSSKARQARMASSISRVVRALLSDMIKAWYMYEESWSVWLLTVDEAEDCDSEKRGVETEKLSALEDRKKWLLKSYQLQIIHGQMPKENKGAPVTVRRRSGALVESIQHAHWKISRSENEGVKIETLISL